MSLIVIGIALISSIYCLYEKDYKKGLILFFIYTSCIEGPLKIMAWGQPIKILIYVIRDLMLYILFSRALLTNFFIKQRQTLDMPKPPLIPVIAFYAAWCAMMIFHPQGLNLLNSVAGLRIHVEMIPLLFFGYYIMNSKKDYRTLFSVIIVCAVLNSVASLIQVVKGIDWLSSIHSGYGTWASELGRNLTFLGRERTVRPPGLGPDMGFAGFYAVFAMPMLVSLVKIFKKTMAAKIILAACFIMLILGVFSSQARSAYALTFIILFVTMLYLSRGIFAKVGLIVVLSAGILLGSTLVVKYFPYFMQRFETVKTLSKTVETITVAESGRLYQITTGVILMAGDYFMGNGLGKVGPGAGIFAKGAFLPKLNSENQMTLGIAEIGVPGVLLLFIIHLMFFLYGRSGYESIKDPEMRVYLAAPMTIITFLFIYWPFGNLISFPNNAFFWFFGGILLRIGNYTCEERALT
jgi:hypothetical protein